MSAISNNQTSMLKAWLADAEEFEIPEATQRGLAFMLALDITFNPPTQDKDEMLELMKLFSKNSPKIAEGIGGYFFNTNITDLLAEFAFKVHPEFKPRVISTTEEGEDMRNKLEMIKTKGGRVWAEIGHTHVNPTCIPHNRECKSYE
jgi:hypothetical protein